MSDNKAPKLIDSDPVHARRGGKMPMKALWLQKAYQNTHKEDNYIDSPETDVSSVQTSTETSTAVSQNDTQHLKSDPEPQSEPSGIPSRQSSQFFKGVDSSFEFSSQTGSEFFKNFDSSLGINSQLDFLPEPKKDNSPEPNDGELPKIDQPHDVTDELPKEHDSRLRVADYEEEEDVEEMNELEAYTFIKDHPAFFEYEIKELIIRHYERTCIYSIAALERMTLNQKIRYVKTHHPEWYAAAYEAAIRDMSIKRNNHPTRW